MKNQTLTNVNVISINLINCSAQKSSSDLLTPHPWRSPSRLAIRRRSPTQMRPPNRKSASSFRSPSHFSLINKDRSGYSGGQRQSLPQKPGAPAEKGKKATKAGTEKGGKDKKQAEKEIGSRPSSQVICKFTFKKWGILYHVMCWFVSLLFKLKQGTYKGLSLTNFFVIYN